MTPKLKNSFWFLKKATMNLRHIQTVACLLFKLGMEVNFVYVMYGKPFHFGPSKFGMTLNSFNSCRKAINPTNTFEEIFCYFTYKIPGKPWTV